MWAGALLALFRIFFLNRTTWWEPIVVGCMALISLQEMYQVMAPHAFWATIASYLASVTGGFVFAYQWPDPWHDTFGFHEIMHLCTSIASVLVYIANYSVVDQCS
jgi:predicted membrane channel-forming protein YqfA (hemolysin III family)